VDSLFTYVLWNVYKDWLVCVCWYSFFFAIDVTVEIKISDLMKEYANVYNMYTLMTSFCTLCIQKQSHKYFRISFAWSLFLATKLYIAAVFTQPKFILTLNN
jgi:hypothetical protein